jgi:hypothetical protein
VLHTVAHAWPGRDDDRLCPQAQEYLRLRRALGHDLADAVRVSSRFVAYRDSVGASTITIDIVLGWVHVPMPIQQVGCGPGA